MIDVQEKKNRIISFLKTAGPSLPVRIAKAIQMDPVFASAIAAELLDTKQIKTSHMKIGSSSLYLIPGDEQKLENHTDNLKPIEKEAFLKLKEKETINDENEPPAIRVALRNIKDFGIPFKEQDKIIWKYAFSAKDTAPATNNKPQTTSTKSPISPEPIFENSPQAKRPTSEATDKRSDRQAKRPITQKTFLNQIEEFLEKQNTKIISIEAVDKKNVIAKIQNSQQAMLFAFNKKRITEQELMKCYKKANESNLPYHIITLGEPTKKMDDTIDAYKKLIKLDKLKT